MQFKRLLFSCLLSLLLLASCRSTQDIIVTLSPTPGLHREMGMNSTTTRPVEPDSIQLAFAKQLGLQSFTFSHYLHRSWEFYYHQWKAGKKDTASYLATLKRFEENAVVPAFLPKMDAESIFLFGRKNTGDYLMVADENNNNKLSDDPVYTIKVPLVKESEELAGSVHPTVHIQNLQGFYRGKVFTFSSTVTLRPFFHTDPIQTTDTSFLVNFLSSETFSGDFRYKGEHYKVATRNTVHPVRSNNQNYFAVKFAEGSESSPFLKQWNTRPEYKRGDTAVVGQKVFFIKAVSPMLTSITLQPLNVAASKVRPKRIDPRMEAIAGGNSKQWINAVYPRFEILDKGKLLSNENLKGKVIFINFWFAACPPCIMEFDALSGMFDKLKGSSDFEFISLTYESPEVIEKVRQKYGLSFPVYSISREECERLNLNNGYPTNIIVDKRGRIHYMYAGGEASKDRARAFVEKEFYTRILQIL